VLLLLLLLLLLLAAALLLLLLCWCCCPRQRLCGGFLVRHARGDAGALLHGTWQTVLTRFNLDLGLQEPQEHPVSSPPATSARCTTTLARSQT
jgi:hypothetical protein